jgi:hypothetical protein
LLTIFDHQTKSSSLQYHESSRDIVFAGKPAHYWCGMGESNPRPQFGKLIY